MINKIIRMKREDCDNLDILFTLLAEDYIQSINVNGKVFGNCQLEEFCKKYASVHLPGSYEDKILNDKDNINEDAQYSVILKICGLEIKSHLDHSIDKLLNIESKLTF